MEREGRLGERLIEIDGHLCRECEEPGGGYDTYIVWEKGERNAYAEWAREKGLNPQPLSPDNENWLELWPTIRKKIQGV